MWHAPNQKIRNLTKKREKSRKTIHIKRISADLHLISDQENKTSTRLILNDLSTKGAGIFSPTPFIGGQEVLIKIIDPKKLEIKARIIWCQQHTASSRVLSDVPFAYRIGVEFIFTSPEDQQKVDQYFEEVNKNFLYSSQAV